MRENKNKIIVNYSRLTPYECQSHECSNTFNKIQKANKKLAQNLVERYLRERREKIYFSINDIADPNLAFSQLFGHEKAHMNTYDEGKDGEETAIHTREKIGSEKKNKVFTEEEKANYLNDLRNKYKYQKSIEQQFAEAKLVPEKDKENFVPALVIGGTALIYRYAPEITEAAVNMVQCFYQ